MNNKNHYVTLIATDIKGSFDQVFPSRLSNTDMDPLYIPWIQHWATNKTMRFRHNNRLDLTSYTVNRGIPQGSPLSAFLFSTNIKNAMKPRILYGRPVVSKKPHISMLTRSREAFLGISLFSRKAK